MNASSAVRLVVIHTLALFFLEYTLIDFCASRRRGWRARENPPELGPDHPNCTVHHDLIPSLSAFACGAKRKFPRC